MKILRLILIVTVLAAVPVIRYAVDFRAGTQCRPCGFMMVPSWFVFFPGSFVAAVIAGFLFPAKKTATRIKVAVATFFLSPLLAIVAVPGGVVIYSHGFEHSIQKSPGIGELQQWAEKTITGFQSGILCVTGKPSDWSVGDVLISTNDLPSFLKTGTFSQRKRGHLIEPEISICTKYGTTRSPEECIAISWYLHGLLIGPPSFTNHWDVLYCRQLAPGVFSYFIEK